MDEFVDHLLRDERYCDIILPRLTKRSVLEETEGLKPRKSLLVRAASLSFFFSVSLFVSFFPFVIVFMRKQKYQRTRGRGDRSNLIYIAHAFSFHLRIDINRRLQ